ncbi:unnamed protein product [Psylliodes chrysocephalus]|uniref:PDEase domain-containing protein n=1 Tax=Psylliodes chrysocephalus TaxID=3402493 RepID=A0A9P0D2G6_9CUCU|nr:unnamed protein product [Psylliodes chrysocephala]
MSFIIIFLLPLFSRFLSLFKQTSINNLFEFIRQNR